MPSILSKLLMSEWSFPYNCYEVGHTWTPYCSEAALGLALVVFRESIKLYTPLYLFTQIIQRKYDSKSFQRTALSVIRSSAFLAFTALSTLTLFCGVRSISDKFYWTLVAFVPAFFGSLMSIVIERPSRRGTLAVYCANIASETLFRTAVSRGYISAIPKGEVILFSISMSVILYLVRKYGYGSDPVSVALKIILGPEEAKRKNKSREISENNICHKEKLTDKNDCISFCENKLQNNNNNNNNKFINNRFFSFLKLFKHDSCAHKNSCFGYISMGFLKPFTYGWLAQTALLLSKPKIFKSLGPKLFFETLFSQKSLKFGLFLGGFSSAYKLINCSLRHYNHCDNEWHALIAG